LRTKQIREKKTKLLEKVSAATASLFLIHTRTNPLLFFSPSFTRTSSSHTHPPKQNPQQHYPPFAKAALTACPSRRDRQKKKK
jgi:hypothetical protein